MDDLKAVVNTLILWYLEPRQLPPPSTPHTHLTPAFLQDFTSSTSLSLHFSDSRYTSQPPDLT